MVEYRANAVLRDYPPSIAAEKRDIERGRKGFSLVSQIYSTDSSIFMVASYMMLDLMNQIKMNQNGHKSRSRYNNNHTSPT